MEELEGSIFGIQRFSIDDGPGIRTTVFLKGCNMSCVWCHNPESYCQEVELMFFKTRCNVCGVCETICQREVHQMTSKGHQMNRDRCRLCGACVAACPTQALTFAGWNATPEKIMEAVKRDVRYYNSSGGGLTISGGEPMMQPVFAIEIARLAYENDISVVIETNGCGAFIDYVRILPFVDLFFFDYKVTNPSIHEQVTGRTINQVLDTIEKLNDVGASIVLRCPIIPQINDNEAHFRAIAALTNRYKHVQGFELMPYHKLGIAKAERMGLKGETFREPDKQEVAEWNAKVLAFGGLPWRQKSE